MTLPTKKKQEKEEEQNYKEQTRTRRGLYSREREVLLLLLLLVVLVESKFADCCSLKVKERQCKTPESWEFAVLLSCVAVRTIAAKKRRGNRQNSNGQSSKIKVAISSSIVYR